MNEPPRRPFPLSLALKGAFAVAALLLVWLIVRELNSPDAPLRTETNSQVVMQQIRQLARLELVEFQMRDVMTKTIENRYWFNDTKVLLIISGQVVAGLDLQKLTVEDFHVADDSVHLTLPRPEILTVKVDHENTRIYDGSFTVVDYIQNRHGEILEQTFREAEGQIRRSAVEQRILTIAQGNAEKFFQPFLRNLGYTRVGLSFAADSSTAQ